MHLVWGAACTAWSTQGSSLEAHAHFHPPPLHASSASLHPASCHPRPGGGAGSVCLPTIAHHPHAARSAHYASTARPACPAHLVDGLQRVRVHLVLVAVPANLLEVHAVLLQRREGAGRHGRALVSKKELHSAAACSFFLVERVTTHSSGEWILPRSCKSRPFGRQLPPSLPASKSAKTCNQERRGGRSQALFQLACRWLATFSRVMPSTFIIVRIFLGTACFSPCGGEAGRRAGPGSSAGHGREARACGAHATQ